MIPVFEPWLNQREIEQVTDSICNNWITGGPKVKAFEERIARLCGVKHAIACMNGTVALYMGLKAMGIGEGDEVIVPDFTFIASANAVTWTGAKPVFVDIRRDTFNIALSAIAKVITTKTKAIMPVHIYGQSADMDAVMASAVLYKLLVIEDAAQGIGVKWQGKPVGGIGDIGTLSFYADKTITTGEGGMVLTNNNEYARQCLILKHQGRTGRGFYRHEYIGYNFRMTDLQAGIGLAQLEKLDEIIERKHRIAKKYYDALADVKGVEVPFVDARSKTVPFRVNILVDNPVKLGEYLAQRGIQTRGFFLPLHQQPCYQQSGEFPNALWAYGHGLSLPSGVRLTDSELQEVIEGVKSYYV